MVKLIGRNLNISVFISGKGSNLLSLIKYSKIKNSNHFFKNKEKELTIEIEKYLKEKTALI